MIREKEQNMQALEREGITNIKGWVEKKRKSGVRLPKELEERLTWRTHSGSYKQEKCKESG